MGFRKCDVSFASGWRQAWTTGRIGAYFRFDDISRLMSLNQVLVVPVGRSRDALPYVYTYRYLLGT